MKFIFRASALAIFFVCLAFAATAQAQRLQQTDRSDATTQTLLPSSPDGNCAFSAGADDTGGHGLNLADLDRSVKPCDNFFQFADGGWIKSHPIPPEYPSYGSFTELAESNREKLHTILEAAAKDTSAAAGSVDQKIGDFYFSCMDEPAIEKAGIDPIKDYLARIEKISTAAELQAEIIDMQQAGSGVVFTFGSQPDFKNSSMMIGSAGQGGLGLPDRDYYTKNDEKSLKTARSLCAARYQYVRIARRRSCQGCSGSEDCVGDRDEIGAGVDDAGRSPRSRQDLSHNDRAALKALTPDFDWNGYFHAIGQDSVSSINVSQPEFFKAVDHELTACRWPIGKSICAGI